MECACAHGLRSSLSGGVQSERLASSLQSPVLVSETDTSFGDDQDTNFAVLSYTDFDTAQSQGLEQLMKTVSGLVILPSCCHGATLSLAGVGLEEVLFAQRLSGQHLLLSGNGSGRGSG